MGAGGGAMAQGPSQGDEVSGRGRKRTLTSKAAEAADLAGRPPGSVVASMEGVIERQARYDNSLCILTRKFIELVEVGGRETCLRKGANLFVTDIVLVYDPRLTAL